MLGRPAAFPEGRGFFVHLGFYNACGQLRIGALPRRLTCRSGGSAASRITCPADLEQGWPGSEFVNAAPCGPGGERSLADLDFQNERRMGFSRVHSPGRNAGLTWRPR